MKLYFPELSLTLAGLSLFLACSHKGKLVTQNKSAIQKEIYLFKNLPTLKDSQDKVKLGGFSGLAYEGVNPKSGKKSFLTHTDRGPNSEQEITKEGKASRRFAVPAFTPQIVRFELEEATLSANITSVIPLKSKSGKLLSGQPNVDPKTQRADADEVPRSMDGESLSFDPSGLDLEAILQSADGDYWMVDEYRPSIVQFSKDGKLKNRYIPIGSRVTGMEAAVEVLPSSLAKRQMNRGFEGLARQGDKLYAFLQSPIDPKGIEIPIIEFDLKSRKVSQEYTYTLESKKADKIGDAIAIGKNKFLVIEQNSKTDSGSFRKIFEVTLDKGRTTRKKLIADLSELGFAHIEKFEGLAVLGPRGLALLSDNDFSFAREEDSLLVILHFSEDLFE